jgi:MATE family multidrug resistance protein
LNVVFMYGAGPVPPLGGAGAGVATGLLAWLMFATSVAVWRFDPYFARFRSGAVHGPRWKSLRELLKLGLPIGLATLFEVTSFTFMAVLIARLGTAAVAGHQVVANFVALLFMLPLSLGIATSVLVAQSLGAGYARVARQAALRGFRTTMMIALVAATTLWLARDRVVALYTNDPAVAAIALSLAGLAALFHFFDAGQGVAGFILRGYKNTFWPMVIYGVALWGIGLGGGVWLGLGPNPLGAPRGPLGFWEAATVALALAAIALSALAEFVARRHARDGV